MKVTFFHRKPRPGFNFSVENLFKHIREALPASVTWEVKEMRFFSKGFFKRLYICLEAAMHQNGVSHVTGDINFVTIFLRKRYTVLTVLDVGFMNRPPGIARWLLKWFWIKLPVSRSSVITTISESTKLELLKYSKTDPARIKVVYVPISGAFSQDRKPFNKSEPVILQIGTKPNKNVTRLVRALEGLPCKLEVIGAVNEALREELEKSNIKFNASKDLTNDQIVEKYRGADILTFVSTYEGFGMPIVEANAIGRVVVTSNVLSMPEVAGNAACLVDPFDIASIRNGILRVIRDDAYREQLIQNGFENRKRFDVFQIARQYADIYSSLSKG